jgi:3-deoxy-D-manno-octulosonic-acid transferase
METELWPNLLHYANRKNIPVLLANARLSEKSAKGYQRYYWFTHTMFEQITHIAAQSPDDAKRFEQLHVPKNKIQITGTIKFDMVLPHSIKEGAEHLRQQIGAYRPVWIAASTREGEEERILEAFALVKKQLPNCLLILVPRHPERFEKVKDMCRNRLYSVITRSSQYLCTENTDILLGDTMGELMLFYGSADVAFVGGTLLPYGGQNVLEPALFGLPIITGPHLFNFSEAARLLQDAHALVITDHVDTLAHEVIRFLQDAELRKATGERAQKVVEDNRGAVDRHMMLINRYIAAI